ncbi:MAG: restriction endonuclease subunit S [Cellvibrio sp.]
MTAQQIITQHLDIWTAAHKSRSGVGRGSSNKLDLYGIKKLRELILELAVRGKLVSQDPNDEPAIELLERIAIEKAKLVKSGAIKKEKPLPIVDENEVPFDLPNEWQFVRLQTICKYIQRGKGPVYADNGRVRVVSQKCVQWSGFDIEQARYVNETSLSAYQEERYLQANDLLWNSTGTGTVGRVVALTEIEPKTLVADSHVTVIRPIEINSKFLCFFISAPGIQKRVEPGSENALVSGTTNQVELNTSSVMSVPVPIPPLAEQHRIVAKVDELMAFCDQLEQTQSDNIAAHAQLVEALLATLTDSRDHNELQNNWQRIAAHFDTLFTTEHSIDQLKQTILQLAVMGKLVPQNPNDEPASELLKKIAAEKAQLIKEGKIKKEKPLPEITDEEKPFELPSGWRWSKLGLIGETNIGLTYKPSNVTENGVPVLRSSNIQNGKIDLTDLVRVSGLEIKESLVIQVGDLLICARNGSKALVGKTAQIKELSEITSFGAFMAVFRSSLNNYIELFLNSPIFRKNLDGVDTTTINQITQGNLIGTLIPIPPLAEQHRIVTKVDELMVLCDTLKTNLQSAQTTQLALADALVESVIGVNHSSSATVKNEEVSMEIKTSLELNPNVKLKKDAVLANIINAEEGSIDAKRLWQKSKMDLPGFYKQLKKEISAGYILKPAVAEIQ